MKRVRALIFRKLGDLTRRFPAKRSMIFLLESIAC